MAPPVPATCDACATALPQDERLICGRCKAFAYCVSGVLFLPVSTGQLIKTDSRAQNATCQAHGWPSHTSGCSALPAGQLVPAKVTGDASRATEVDMVKRILNQFAKAFTVGAGDRLGAQVGR